jgi:aryl-alcohol dehydrogenase-like predicted oxidoreductase
MDRRNIGSLEVSVVGIGCNNFGRRMDDASVDAVVAAAIDEGINFFDTADMYADGRSEELLGIAAGDRRDEVVIATKFGGGEKRGEQPMIEYVRERCDASLARLGTDRIDLYQLHFPDTDVPIAETLAALGALVEEGKVLEIGCSNFTAEMLREAEAASADAGVRFVSVQNHYNLLQRGEELEVLPTCEELGLAYLPYFPLANGLLTGKYRRGESPPEGSRLAGNRDRASSLLSEANLDQVERLTALADESGHSTVELAIAWLLSRPALASVIAGATKVEQVLGNARGGSWQLSDAELAAIEEIAPA